MITDLKTAKQVLNRKRYGQFALIFGNGINRYAYGNDYRASWEDMLLNIWERVSTKKISTISEGVSFTEFYNIIGLGGWDIDKLRQAVVDYTEEKYKPNNYHKWLCKRLQEWNVPILTTNFDSNLENDLKMFKLYKTQGKQRGFTDYYPWNAYFSQNKINNPLVHRGTGTV